jgi:hypothetical protein
MKQTIHACVEFPDCPVGRANPDAKGCTVIIGGDWPREPGSWCSHALADVEPAERCDPDAPAALDRRKATR